MSKHRGKNQNIVGRSSHAFPHCRNNDFAATSLISSSIISLHLDITNMSDVSTSPLLQLPVELLFQIFDDLDAHTLFFALGQTCRRLRSLIHNYDRLAVDFTLLSKPQFHCLLNVIDPHNVTSVTLTDPEKTPDLVSLFCSHYRQRPFDRLQSLLLNELPQSDLQNILKCIQPTFLTSFTIRVGRMGHARTRTFVDGISSIIANPDIRQFGIGIQSDIVHQIQWPNTNAIKQLKLHSSLRMDELCVMLDHLPYLQILSVANITNNLTNNQTKVKGFAEKFRQLRSLTVNHFGESTDDVKYLLSLTSSLTHLKLVGKGDYRDGERWEQFIQLNLPHLRRFEFFFEVKLRNLPASVDARSIVSSFRSPFWLEQKKWIVHDEVFHVQGVVPVLNLYSLPLCVDIYTCRVEAQRKAMSCASIIDPPSMNNITALHWYVSKSATYVAEDKVMIRYGYALFTVNLEHVFSL